MRQVQPKQPEPYYESRQRRYEQPMHENPPPQRPSHYDQRMVPDHRPMHETRPMTETRPMAMHDHHQPVPMEHHQPVPMA